jgi:hypothetical protein
VARWAPIARRQRQQGDVGGDRAAGRRRWTCVAIATRVEDGGGGGVDPSGGAIAYAWERGILLVPLWLGHNLG